MSLPFASAPAAKWAAVPATYVAKNVASLPAVFAAESGVPEIFTAGADQFFSITLGIAFMWAFLTGRVRFHDEDDSKIQESIKSELGEVKTELAVVRSHVESLNAKHG